MTLLPPRLPDAWRLARQQIDVVILPLASTEHDVAEARSVLSHDELQRADRYRIPHVAHHFVMCRAALRRLLAGLVNCPPRDVEFVYGRQGKPRLAPGFGDALHFSVSHSAEWALLAFAIDRELGIDLEHERPETDCLGLARRFFATAEADWLDTLPEDRRRSAFFQMWTCKEAFIKAMGDGLACPLDAFCIDLTTERPAVLVSDGRAAAGHSLCLGTIPISAGYYATVCAPGDDWLVRTWRGPARA